MRIITFKWKITVEKFIRFVYNIQFPTIFVLLLDYVFNWLSYNSKLHFSG
jgi:hypothetical protein